MATEAAAKREPPRRLNVPEYRQAIRRALEEYKTAVDAAVEDLVYSLDQAESGLMDDFNEVAQERRPNV